MLQRHQYTASQVVTLPVWGCPTKQSPRLRTQIQIIVSVRLVTSNPPLTGTSHLCAVYYRIYAEDGAIPTKTSVSPGDPFLGRIKAISVPPPHTVKAVKHSIAKLENIKDRTKTSLFLTLYSESPIGDAEKVTIRNRTSLGSTPQEPLALVAKMSDTERRALEYEVTSALELEPARITELEPARITEIYCDKAAEVAEPYWDNLKAVEPEAPEPEVAEPALPAWARAEPARAITAEPASATATPEIRYRMSI